MQYANKKSLSFSSSVRTRRDLGMVRVVVVSVLIVIGDDGFVNGFFCFIQLRFT